MKLKFLQDHAGVKAGEVLNLLDVRTRIEYAVYFSDAALAYQLVHANVASEVQDPAELRTATKEKPARKAVKR